MCKRFLILIAVLLVGMLCFSPVPAVYAQARGSLQVSQPLTASGICVDADGNAMDYGIWVYGWWVFAEATNSRAGLKDCDTTAELYTATEYAIDEIGEPTQYEITDHSFVELYGGPIYFSDGVGIAKTTYGTYFVIYGPKPAA